MTDQGARDLLARGNVFGGRADDGFVPKQTVPRDYNSNITKGEAGNGYSYDDPYQGQQRNPADGNDEEEALAAERDLAEDAMWKRIQHNTFTRWTNVHLKCIEKQIESLETDFSDGLNLIALIEVLSQKKAQKHNKKPSFRSQKCENVEIALKFLEREGIKIINIDSADVVDGKLKLILGLIWALILHYSISMPMWDGEDAPKGGQGPTPKQRLMHWVQNKIPEVPITNFTNDWNDGKAVGALVDACAPGLCPDWANWDPKNALQNAKEAMGLADDWLNVPQLVKPEDMVNPAIDEQSMMTYLSQYPNAKLKPGAPIKPGGGPNRVRAYGPGIEPKGPSVNAPANFTVETFAAGKGKVDVVVLDPHGAQVPCDVRFNNDKNLTYSCSYIPKVEGLHKVIVKYNDKEIPRSPFKVQVEGTAGEASKVVASGPGIQPEGVSVNRPTHFDIMTKGAGKGTPEVIILDPSGSKTSIIPKLIQKGPDFYRCEYVTPHVGVHSVNVFFAGKPIPNSPFGVKVSPASDSKKVRASGRGLQPTGVRVGDDADFNIYTEGAGEGTPVVRIIGPGGVNYNCKIQKVDATTYECHYFPNKEGRYRVMLTFDGKEIQNSPFDVAVGPKFQTNVIAYGPGLHGGVAEHPATFTVETNGDPGKLSFSVAGPSQAPLTVRDNEDGSCAVTYLPKVPGEYYVHVLIDEQDIPKSPFLARIQPKNDIHPENVKTTGPGIQPTGVQLEQPTHFIVNTKQAGNAPLEVKVTDCTGEQVEVNVVEQKDGTKKCVYVPKRALPHTVDVNFGNVATPNSPYRVKVAAPLNPAKVQAFGPWVDGDVRPNQPTHFNVDAREAGEGDLKVQVVNDQTKKEIVAKVIDNCNQTYSVEIDSTELETGTYTTTLYYGGVKVPTSHKTNVTPSASAPQTPSTPSTNAPPPFQPKKFVQPATVNRPAAPATPTTPSTPGTPGITPAELSKVKVQGLEKKVIQKAENEFCVDMKSVITTTKTTTTTTSSKYTRIETSRFTCRITDSRGRVIESKCVTDQNDLLKILYTPMETGKHTIDCAYDNVPLPGAPFMVDVKGGNDVSRVRAYGPGLQGGVPNQPAKFTVETKKAGVGRLSFAIEGPSEARLSCVDNRDGTCDVSFFPTAAGEYDLTVKFDDKEIPGSPFRVNIGGVPSMKGPVNVPRVPAPGNAKGDVKVFGPGLGNGEIRDGCPTEFYVDCSEAGPGKVGVQLKSSDGSQVLNLKIYDKGNGVYAVSFTAPRQGATLTAHVKYAEKEVKGSPFVMKVGAKNDPRAVRVTGDLAKKKVPASLPVKFQVDSTQAGQGDIVVTILDPEKKMMLPKIQPTGPGVVDVSFVPDEMGPYQVGIKFDGKDVAGSPFQLGAQPTGNADKCKLLDMDDELEFGKQNKLTVDARNAGPGAVTCRIVKSGKNTPVDVRVVESKPRLFDILYTLDDAGEYDIDVKFGGRPVPDGAFSLNLE
ncbi:filamin-A-like isoform X2 [Culicoides brevitarsis]|uniref:filamin-A-like isoform X2 n=1 Tax=Culicoides brevitarsis TaxID=469753 RepID=UPI00307BAA03